MPPPAIAKARRSPRLRNACAGAKPSSRSRARYWIEGEERVGSSFAGMDAMDEVHGRGLRIEGAQAHFVLAYHQGDTFTFICERPT